MPPRFQRFLRTEGILGKVWCHIEKGTYHRPRTGWVHLMISYYGRVAILGYIEIQVFISISQTKQTNETARERRKERKKKETRTGWARNLIFKGAAL